MIITEENINADFRGAEVTALRDEADIVVTNSPFSMFRGFLSWIMEGHKQFIILGSMNALTYKEVFPLIRDNRVWLGASIHSGGVSFYMPDGSLKELGCIRWFTNMCHSFRYERLNLLTKSELEQRGVLYQKYDNYDAIEVPKVKWLPSDYDGVMGVPISFLDKYNPEQFEIIGMANNVRWIGSVECLTIINGSAVYNRVLIRNKFNS